ncbi:metalloprotease TldD [Ehrlichia canis]|uniref:metalloprotease TldD n=1 Tax=Ehrlichia canis TaxID=944 RepID=UPI0005C669C6|nr:metalloprotease TldD [Ehrlichia canis]AUO55184.1 metalloprotease TldD [Ehrlichia canis]UKC53118.1 tldD [Ehrlichia canis]UKC54055.1 tldD [Ehrlichia canis]UKC54991.1 tldD [Ehrlichia canis]
MNISNVEQMLFTRNQINENTVNRVVSDCLCAADGGELFLEMCISEALGFEDGILKYADFNSRQGFGLRSFCKELTAFVCSSEITEQEISNAAALVKSINSSGNGGVIHLNKTKPALYPETNPLQSITFDIKVKLLQEVESYLHTKSPYVKQVKTALSGQWQMVHIILPDGNKVYDIRPLVRFNVCVILEKDGRKESGSAGHGGRASYEEFIGDGKWQVIADEALRQALVNLESIPTPAGEMTVVLGPGWPGVLLHEAVGHGLEGDFNRKKVSAFSNSIGKKVAADGVTVVDDGTISGRRGSINVDDEGVPSSYNVLIQDGILVNYMQDRMNANLMGTTSTGNGRRQSYQDVVIPRMTNTYMLPGNYHPEEIISSVKKGIYAVHFSGGQVDITSGKFVFSASEGYLIEDGKVTHPVKGATIIGNGPDVLTKVSMIGNDLALDSGIGTCSKNGQDLPVGVGQPTLKIDNIVVGGTEV